MLNLESLKAIGSLPDNKQGSGVDSVNKGVIDACKDILLSEHFSVWEMCQNWRGGRVERYNFYFGFQNINKLQKLCIELLEPIRKHFGPLRVNSAMRWARKKPEQVMEWEGLDYEIRSVYTKAEYSNKSQHTSGEAADISSPRVDSRELWSWIRENSPNPFGQAIYEVSSRDAWLHISIPGIRKKDGSLIYGEVLDAKVDSMGRAKYSTIQLLSGKKDPWGKQAELEAFLVKDT